MRTIDILDYKRDTWQLGLPGKFETYNGLTEMWVYVIKGPRFTQPTQYTLGYLQIPVPVFTAWFLTPTERYQARGETETFGTERSIT